MFQKIKKQQQLLCRLQALVHEESEDSTTIHEVMDYFLKRLASTQSSNRALATKVCTCVGFFIALNNSNKKNTTKTLIKLMTFNSLLTRPITK